MIAIVVSRADSASEHVGDHLLDLADWDVREDDSRPDAEGGGTYYRLGSDPSAGFELREFDDLHLDLEDAAEPFGEAWSASNASAERSDARATDPDLLVFASRHSGDTGPLLTAHFTGNFGPAKYGGEAGALAEACPNAHAHLLSAFEKYAPDGYDVGMECTHHGPSRVGVPSLFAELGSDEAQWEDPDGARAVARAILELEGVEPHRSRRGSDAPTSHRNRGAISRRQLVGFDGGHYAPRFTRIACETDWAVGHVAADWGLDAMGAPEANRDVIRRAFEASRAERAVIDGERPELATVVADLGYEVVSETWVRETTGVPLPLVSALEADLSPVADGLRFGDPAADDEGEASVDYERTDLPADLLAEAQGIDAEAAREVVTSRALAFETEQNGTRVAGRAAVRERADREAIVDGLADVLREKYDSVAREDGEVVARETAFAPEKARKLGVPEGPAFGKLSAGESVTVDGEEIAPEAVRTERTRRFPI